MNASTLIAVVGPTAVGKTRLAVQLAQYFATEIISADSRQVYRELNIGTAKPTPEEMGGIVHHFISSHSISDEYNAGQFGRDASDLLGTLFARHPYVVLCGGSGLYVKALCEGLDDMPEVPPGLREKIMAEYEEKGLSWLQERVGELDPDYFAEVDQQNPHRLVRALELNLASGGPMEQLRRKNQKPLPYKIIKIGLELDRDELNRRIDQRMDDMIAKGLLEEARGLFPMRHINALQTVGYQEIFGFMEHRYDWDEAVRLLKRNSRRYAKRQMTWFRRDPAIQWFGPDQFQEMVHFIEGKK